MVEQILYDLIVHEEWMQQPIVLNSADDSLWHYRGSFVTKIWRITEESAKYIIRNVKKQFRYQTSFGCPPHQLINLMSNKLNWSVAFSRDGGFVAILQDDVIEIRGLTEDGSRLVAKCNIDKDFFPQWRKLAWNTTSNILVCASSLGDLQVFDINGLQTFNFIQSKTQRLPGNLSHAISSVFFVKPPAGRNDCAEELFTVTYQGLLRGFSVSETGTCCETFTFSFSSYHPYGISCMVYNQHKHLLVTAGNHGREPSNEEVCYGSHCSISVWRFLNDFPYVTLVEDKENALKKLSGKELLAKLVTLRPTRGNDSVVGGVHKMCFSPEGNILATLHLNGRVTLWNFPSMMIKKTWRLCEQPWGSNHMISKQTSKDSMHQITEITWWSNEELVLACDDGNLTISSKETLVNLLGDSPEKFELQPKLSDAVDGHVMVLECEEKITQTGMKGTEKSSKVWLNETVEEDSFKSRAKELVKQVVYFLTEAERFQPIIKKPRISTNVYRLVCLKSTTPEELFSRKINIEHYGEALDLAVRFQLNTDRVYQRQWQTKPVSRITIHDYLSKVKDRFWVLNECLLRIATDYDSTEQLLKYGLLGTSWEVFNTIDQDEDFQYIIKSNEEDCGEEKIVTERLTTNQTRICKYRRQLLQFLDRLSTYELICGGSFKARERFDAKYFSGFRSCNIVHQAVKFAHEENSYAIEDLFSYHGGDVLPHWLPILSNFPETAAVKDYEILLPEIGECERDPEILPWLEKHHREKDWVEQEFITNQMEDASEDLGRFVYEERPDLLEFKDCHSKQKLQQWFVKRIYEIEERSKQVGNCLELINTAIARGIKGLPSLQSNLETLAILVYEVGIGHQLSLKECTELPHISKVKLLMSKTSEETFIADFKSLLMPYVVKVSRKSPHLKSKLIHQFMVEIATTDLTCCLKLFEKCLPDAIEPLIADVAVVMQLALDCLYACKRSDQLNVAFAIIECLPSREEGVISASIEQLHHQLDKLEHFLGALEMLEYHDHLQNVAFVCRTKDDASSFRDILHTLLKNTLEKLPTAEQWNLLLKHVIKLSKDVYRCIDVQQCHRVFAEFLLQSGSKDHILLAGELLSPGKLAKVLQRRYLTNACYVLNYSMSVNVVLTAAREYFNAATSVNDSSMELFKVCLALIVDSHDSIQAELDLLDSLALLKDFDVNILPVQVRLCGERIELFDMCLARGTTHYKHHEKLLRLAQLLQICGDDVSERNGKVRCKIAQSAFDADDYPYAASQCYHLIEQTYAKAWQICKMLGECEKYTNLTVRQRLLSFALTFCPAFSLEEILNSKSLLQTQELYEKMSLHIQKDEDRSGSSLVDQTKSTTKRFLSSVSRNRIVEGAVKWVKESVVHHYDDSSSRHKDSAVKSLRLPPFYSSNPATKIEDVFPALFTPDTTQFLLLQIQKLTERRSEGNVSEDTTDALLFLAEEEFTRDILLGFGYMESLESSCLQTVFDKHRNTTFTFIMAAYAHALCLHCKENRLCMSRAANVFNTCPVDLLRHTLAQSDCSTASARWGHITANLRSLSDSLQARMLQGLGKGVDVERFATDDDYKKETILGLAMSSEEDLMKTSLLLAEKYDVDKWEVMLAHVEHLFTEGGLSATEIRDALNKWNVENILKERAAHVFQRLKERVYPELHGNQHNVLLLFYVFLLNCTSPEYKLQGELTLKAHIALLKKVKSTVTSVNYKDLVHGDNPLAVIETVVNEKNVRLLVKIATRIPRNDGSYISPSTVFLIYAKKMFWHSEGEKVDVSQRLQAFQQIFHALSIEDVAKFAEDALFTELSVDSLTVDERHDIAKKILRCARQRKGKKEEAWSPEEEQSFDEVEQHLLKILEHMSYLKSDHFTSLPDTPQIAAFARQFDLSQSDAQRMARVCEDMLRARVAMETISKLLPQNEVDVCDAFQKVLKECLYNITHASQCGQFKELVNLVSSGDETISPRDVLHVVRPFCADVNVSTEIKTEILHVMKDDLSDEDMSLLLFFHSDSIISHRWTSIKISCDDTKSEETRNELFLRLLSETTSEEQIDGLEQLQVAWCSGANRSHDDSWLDIIKKRLSLSFTTEKVMSTLHTAQHSTELSQEFFYRLSDLLRVANESLLATKVLLSSPYEECVCHAYANFAQRLDDELFRLIILSKTFHRAMQTDLNSALTSRLLTAGDDVFTAVIDELTNHDLLAHAAHLTALRENLHPSYLNLRSVLFYFKSK